MQMASSITKTLQTAWGPWATCLLRWSSSRSSSKSRWNVSIIRQPGRDGPVFIDSLGVRACVHDWWDFLKWAVVTLWVMSFVCTTRKFVVVFSPYKSWRNWCLSLGNQEQQDTLSHWLLGISLQTESGLVSLHVEGLLFVCWIHLVIAFPCRLIPF